MNLLHYRTWKGTPRAPLWSAWPVMRVALGTLLQRRLFWVLYGFGLLLFLMFFFGSYLFAWAEAQLTSEKVRAGRVIPDPQRLLRSLRQGLRFLNGSQDTFSYFMGYQGSIVIVTLALAGTQLVGNDFRNRTLVFYLAKPIHRWHYLLGKFLAVAVVVLLMTALPALGLFAQHALDDWDYLLNPNFFGDNNLGGGPAGVPLLLGILGYGALLAAFLSILLVTTASWLRLTIPLIMAWTTLFFFLRLLANVLVDGLKYSEHWRLIDLWNDLTLLGDGCLGMDHEQIAPQPQPPFWEAGLVLLGVAAVCLIYLNRRTRDVEIAR